MSVVKFSVKNISEFKEDDNPELALGKVEFLSTAKNTHKINITEKLLKDNSDTILGKFLIGEMDWTQTDVTRHTEKQVIFGYYPKEQEIKYRRNENGDLVASAYVVISKLYAYNFYKMFLQDNFRDVSVEMQTYGNVKNPDGSIDIKGFNLCGTTCLGKKTNGSCPDANIQIVQFSEKKAEEYFKSKFNDKGLLSKFAEDRNKEYVDHPVDTSKESIYDGEWDGDKAKHDLIDEKKFKSLAHKVCLDLEDGWEEREVSKLKYPVMGLYDGKWRYSRKALASAKAYAEKENNETVLSKVNTIYKKLQLGGNMEERVKELEEQVANFESKCAELEEKCKEFEDEVEKKDSEIKEKDSKIEEKEAELSEKEEIITAKEVELSELKQFKLETLDAQKTEKVNVVLSQIKDKVEELEYAAIVKQFEECTIDTFDAIKNQVFASIGEKFIAKQPDATGNQLNIRFSQEEKKPKGLWD